MDDKNPVTGNDDLASFIRANGKLKRRERDFNLLDAETNTYIRSDKQSLQTKLEQAQHTGETKQIKYLKVRLKSYYIIEDFFFYLAEHGYSTQLINITTVAIEAFINRQRSISQYKPTKQSFMKKPSYDQRKRADKGELRIFFDRAEQQGVLRDNPLVPLIKVKPKMFPTQLSPRNRVDCQTFEKYLQRLVDNNRLSPNTASNYKKRFHTFLYDIEQHHLENKEWPTELDDLFADPKWIFEWLNNLENRKNGAQDAELAQVSVYSYMLAVRHTWLFLKKQQRAGPNFYNDLKDLFRLDDRFVILPGRSAKVIPALSEAEQEAVLACIERFSTSTVLRLRDKALIMTAIETTMRLESLHSMRLEHLKELEPGVFAWWVKAKRSPKKDARSKDRLGEDNAEWRDWYVSPHALSLIESYLKETERTWQSTGSVWLTYDGRPLSMGGLRDAITAWLKTAGCRFPRPHVLRHTGIERLVNKFNKPIPTVQAISQHADPAVLINVYAKGAMVDAFRRVNQVYPDETAAVYNCQEMVVSIGVRLNELSAEISRRKQDKRVFTHQHAEELLVALRQEITRLVNFLGLTSSTEAISLSREDYGQLKDALESVGLSIEQVLGRTLELPTQIVIKRPRPQPSSQIGFPGTSRNKAIPTLLTDK